MRTFAEDTTDTVTSQSPAAGARAGEMPSIAAGRPALQVRLEPYATTYAQPLVVPQFVHL